MDTMAQGAQASNQSSQVANSMMSNVQKSMQSSSDLAFKMTKLLKDEQARKFEQAMKTQQSIEQQYQFDVNKQVQDQRTKIMQQNANTSASNAGITAQKWALEKPLAEKKAKVMGNVLDRMGKPSTAKVPGDEEIAIIMNPFNTKLDQKKQEMGQMFVDKKITEEQYTGSVAQLDEYGASYKAQVLDGIYTKQRMSQLTQEAADAKFVGVPFYGQSELDTLKAKVAKANTIEEETRQSNTKMNEDAFGDSNQWRLDMGLQPVGPGGGTGGGTLLSGGVQPGNSPIEIAVSPQTPFNFDAGVKDALVGAKPEVRNNVAREITNKAVQTMTQIPPESKSAFTQSQPMVSLGATLVEDGTKASSNQYSRITANMNPLQKENYNREVFRNGVGTSNKIFYNPNQGEWQYKGTTDTQTGTLTAGGVTMMNKLTDNEHADRFANLIKGTSVGGYALNEAVAFFGFTKDANWNALANSQKMRKFDRQFSQGKNSMGITPYATLGAYTDGIGAIFDKTKNHGFDFLGFFGNSVKAQGEQTWKGVGVNTSTGEETSLSPYFVKGSKFIETMKKNRPTTTMYNINENTFATGGPIFGGEEEDTFITAKEAYKQYQKHLLTLNPEDRQTVHNNSTKMILALNDHMEKVGVTKDGAIQVKPGDDTMLTIPFDNLATGNTDMIRMSVTDVYLAAIAQFGGIVQ